MILIVFTLIYISGPFQAFEVPMYDELERTLDSFMNI